MKIIRTTILSIALLLVASCCKSLFAQVKPATINRIMADQKNWQLKQLPANSVQRKMEWSKVPYEVNFKTNKQQLNDIALPAYREMPNPFAALMGQQEDANPLLATQTRNGAYRLSRLPKRFLPYTSETSISNLPE